MEVAMVETSGAGGARERLASFVGEMAWRLPHVRQRENALVYVRGLIEQGAVRVCSRRCFGSASRAARYESVQQFLADSPWDPELLVRACAERVAPEIGVVAWMVDDTGFPKDGRRSPGVKRQYSGTLGKIGNCQSASRCTRPGCTARCRWAGALPAGGVVRRPSGGAGRRSPRRSGSRPKPSSRAG